MQGQRGEISLRTLLLLFTGGLLVIILVASFITSYTHFRDYVADQLSDHALDGATAAGLSLSNAIDGSDPVASASLIDAVFDSGRYLSVEYLGHNGEVIAGRRMPLRGTAAPDWFIHLARLPLPRAEAEVVRGWRRLGKVQVVSHPGRAYDDLWRISVGLLIGVLVIGGAGLAALFILVRRLLRPLKSLERQARAWGRRDFRGRVQVRSTRDLNRVTEAMNQMADDLEILFDGQGRLIQHLRKLNNEDPVTGLPGRNAFDQRLKVEVESEERAAPGVLVLLQLAHFADYNLAYGREEGDQLLRQIAQRLTAFVARHAQSFAGRRTGAEFSVYLPGASARDARGWIGELLEELDSLYGDLAAPMDTAVHAGLAMAMPDAGVRDLLAAADEALRSAQASPETGCRVEQASANGHHTLEAWRKLLTAAVEAGQLSLWLQPMVQGEDQALVHYQAFSRIPSPEGDLRASAFLPVAERLGLTAGIDRMVVARVLAMLKENPEQTLAISLGVATVADELFAEDFLERLNKEPALVSRLWVGVPELALNHHRKQAGRLVHALARLGVPVVVDRFGVGGVPFSYLRNLPFRGIRIDNSFIHQIDSHHDNRFWVEAVTGIARSRGVRVFAAGVETEAEYSVLCALGIDGAMGYYLGRPFAADD